MPLEGLTLTANIATTLENTRSNNLYSTFGSASSTDGDVYVESTRSFGVNTQYWQVMYIRLTMSTTLTSWWVTNNTG